MELILGLAFGIAVGIVVVRVVSNKSTKSAQNKASDAADASAEDVRRRVGEAEVQARRHADDLRAQVERELEGLRAETGRREKSAAGLEERVSARAEVLDRREEKLESREQVLLDKERQLDSKREDATRMQTEQRQALERVAGMSATDAKGALVREITDEAKRDALATVRELEQKAREEGDRRARKIVVTAIQRLGAEQAQEASISVFQLPNEEMKGRIIGREGRNIRHFEQTTGVNLIVDDTPEAILLSCFDPVRREIARIAIEALVGDGRINPARIEEQVDRARNQVEQEIRSGGEEAIVEVGLTGVHQELVRALGRLKYRYSYGQNVLRHVIEASQIAGMIAAELGSDVTLAKRCTIFHDIGKALTHEVEGSHARIGADLARRLGESPEVCHAIEAHHGEVEMRTLEAVICQAADAISGSRPGARRESLEAYVQRLERLEEIAKSFTGVEKTYAMQAGREVRVMVAPGNVDDVQAGIMAREIAKRIEEELQYPGQIRVVVLRELRAIEYAR